MPRALPALQGTAAPLIFLSEAAHVATRTSSIAVRIELSEAFRGRVCGRKSFGYLAFRHARIVRGSFACLGEEGQNRSDAHGARCRRLVRRPCGCRSLCNCASEAEKPPNRKGGILSGNESRRQRHQPAT